jgi:DNA-binding transcriptional MerR regulator
LSELPDKQYFKIGEVARITGVKPHVLRYWETEFTSIRPQKTRTNQRLYRRRDVELLIQIKQLLYQEGFTIAGANKRLRELARQHGPSVAEAEVATLAVASSFSGGPPPASVLREVRAQIAELIALCDDDGED